jgi:hypothetical protein
MEETEVDLKVPHDPISMLQEVERFRKTGKRDKSTVNTKNILFIMSGAFTGLVDIIHKRIAAKGIGFGANLPKSADNSDVLKQIKSEDLISFGFESEFVGRLPVRAIFENLTEADLFEILHNPNNPIMLGKKLDFAAYGIDIKFDEDALKILAKIASEENTGARGLVSAVEGTLLPFERKLPSTSIREFPVTERVIHKPEEALTEMIAAKDSDDLHSTFEELSHKEQAFIRDYLRSNTGKLAENYSLTMTAARIDTVANCYSRHIVDVGTAIRQIRSYYDEVKQIELFFFKNHDINVVLEEDAIDFIIDKFVTSDMHLDEFYKKLNIDFEHGLKLVREKTGKNRFFINREALLNPETYIRNSLATELNLP